MSLSSTFKTFHGRAESTAHHAEAGPPHFIEELRQNCDALSMAGFTAAAAANAAFYWGRKYYFPWVA